MATHAQNIENLRNAVYGEQVRGSMIELFEEDYNLVKDGVGVGTDVSSETSPTTGFSDGAVYINNFTWHLFKLEGTAWSDKGIIQGAQGVSVTGSVDNGDGTFYLTFSDGTRSTDIATIQGLTGPQGPQGPTGATGPAGRDVTSITMSGTGKSHPVTATYSDGSTQTIGVVQDGADGSGTGDMSKSTYDPSDHGYVDAAAGVTDGTNTLTYATLNNKATKATTLAGYGITDAYNMTQSDGKYVPKPEASVTAGKVLKSDGSSGASWETNDLNGLADVTINSSAPNQAVVYDPSSQKYKNRAIVDYLRYEGVIMGYSVTNINTWTSLTFPGIDANKTYIPMADTTQSGAAPSADKGKQAKYRNMQISGTDLTLEVYVPVNPTIIQLLEITTTF